MQNWRALQNLMQIWEMQRQAGHKKPWTVGGTSVRANSNANIIYGLLSKKHSNIFQDYFNHIGLASASTTERWLIAWWRSFTRLSTRSHPPFTEKISIWPFPLPHLQIIHWVSEVQLWLNHHPAVFLSKSIWIPCTEMHHTCRISLSYSFGVEIDETSQ